MDRSKKLSKNENVKLSILLSLDEGKNDRSRKHFPIAR
jgi:hypothetical protein